MKRAIHKKIIVSVTNDLVADNRVHKVCTTLTSMGFDVLLLGRYLKSKTPLKQRSYNTKRFRLLFRKGLLFYACYNLRLFLFLIFTKSDLLLSNDLDSLPANFLASRLKNKPLIYDSHEYFTEVPELINRPCVKRVWEWLEQRMVPKIKYAYTVCSSIAAIYEEKYGTTFRVVRNVPVSSHLAEKNLQEERVGKKIILYQGAVNLGRGLKQAVSAMHFIDGAKLVIAGDGDLKPELEEQVKKENLEHKVEFSGRLPLEELALLTPTASVGLSVEEDFGLNYRFALPNKLFDYIQARVPVLVTNLPEMAAVVNKYQIGEVVNSLDPKQLAAKIAEVLNNAEKRKQWAKNLKIAALELTWENEEKIVREIFSQFT
ncbi:MAG: glycosyltransferase [Prolixibacteraceae bacterium]|nr:glycosyltransferase [Prolixibacteraceae bacterium]